MKKRGWEEGDDRRRGNRRGERERGRVRREKEQKHLHTFWVVLSTLPVDFMIAI